MEVVILTGACGVGKSSTAKEWAKRKNGALIKGDYFSHAIYKKDFPKWTIEEEKFIAKLAFGNTMIFLENDMPVVIDYVWSSVGIQIMVDKFAKEKMVDSLKVIYLVCDIEENHKRDEQRILSHQMKERVDIVHNELATNEWQDYVVKIDTTTISVKQVCDKIEKL